MCIRDRHGNSPFIIAFLVAHESLHGKCVDFLALGLPVVTHDFRLVLVGDGELPIDQTAFTLTHLPVNDEILVGGFVAIRGHAHLVAEAELVLLDVYKRQRSHCAEGRFRSAA